MELSRRELLRLLGVSGVGAAAGGWGASRLLSVPDAVFERALDGPRVETWKNSICTHCPAGCGIRVRLIDDIPVRVLGNPLYPVNRGGTCPMAEAGIEALFHPDRILQPQKRAGERGSDEWEPVSWEEALSIVTGRLQTLRQKGTPEQLAMLTGGGNDLREQLSTRFMRAFGSPNLYSIDRRQISSGPVRLTQGLDQSPVYDLAHTRLVLNFGADLLDEGFAPVRFNQLYSQLRSRDAETRGRIIHVSSYLSRTASNSSKWIPIRPGTMGALALSVAYVLLEDGTYDRDFAARSFGFTDWEEETGAAHRGFKTLVAEGFYPEKAADITGVPADQIVEIARDFGSAPSAVAICGEQANCATNGLHTGWAIHCLNALKGNFEKPGGVLFRKPMVDAGLPPVQFDEVAEAGLARPRVIRHSDSPSAAVDSLNRIIPALAEGRPYEIDTLLVHRVNPLFEYTDVEESKAALGRIPFIVSVTSVPDETSRWSDLILPEHAFLESWEASLNNPAVEFLHFGVQQPVIEPIHDTRHYGDVLLEAGRRLGTSISESLPWGDYRDFVQDHARSIFSSGEGTLVSESAELSWFEFLKERGWQVFDYSTPEEFWELLLEKGGWWDPAYPEPSEARIFKTISGKFEFYSQQLRAEFQEPDMAAGPDSADDTHFLPRYEPAHFDARQEDLPLHFLAYQSLANMNGRGAHLGLLQEMAGLQTRDYWDSWVEISRESAVESGIDEGDTVRVISPRGQLVTKVRIVPAVMPGIAVMPFGLGHECCGQWGRRIGVNPYTIFAHATEQFSGAPSLISTRVRIEKAAESDNGA